MLHRAITFITFAGRLLVGLRWWNYIDDEGKSHWVYESKKVSCSGFMMAMLQILYIPVHSDK